MAAALALLTIAIPWAGALLVWSVDGETRAQHASAVGFSIAGALAAVALLPFASSDVVFRLSIGGVFGDFTLVPDGLGIVLAIIATVVGSLTIIFSVAYMQGEAQLGRYYALILFFIGAMAGLVLSGSLLYLFLFWEITAYCSYALISFHNDDPRAVAAGIKALIVTQVGGVGLLAGALVIYAYTGSYQINEFLADTSALPAATLNLLAFGILAAAAAKSAQVPFHTWLPDAMEAPTPVSALIHAATMVNAGVYLLARFYPAFVTVPGWATTVVIVGLLSALLAAVMALYTNDLKRVLAYSTVSQLGYMVYAVGVGAIFAGTFHLLSHALFKALLFLGAGAVIHARGTRDMRAMGGLGRRMPVVRTTFVIGALALTGLPIFNGFWSKELVLEAGLTGGPMWAYAGMLLGAGLTALYTARMVGLVFFGAPHGTAVAVLHDAPGPMQAALVPLALGTVASWMLAGALGSLVANTLPFHELHAETTMQIIGAVTLAPATVLALGVIGLGLLAWWHRDRLQWVSQRTIWLRRAAVSSFGGEWVNGRIVGVTQQAAGALRLTQTGQLSWNVLGIVSALLVVLIVIMLGA